MRIGIVGENHSLATRMVPPRFLSKKALEMNHCSAPKKSYRDKRYLSYYQHAPQIGKK